MRMRRRISDGFEKACKVACDNLEEISDTINFTKDDHEVLSKCARTSLSSKMYAPPPHPDDI